MAATKKLSYSVDEDQHAASWETGADVEYEDLPQGGFDEVVDSEYELAADPDYDDTGQAAYDEPADPEYGDEVGEELAAAEQAAVPVAPAAPPRPVEGFAYELGRPVVPLTQQQPYHVVWRGYLKERHPVTGLLLRVPVYQLADGYWDCYREEELLAA
ncbi:MAG: hypothetical protein ACRYFK_15935 [Janthinobacterium lividum]